MVAGALVAAFTVPPGLAGATTDLPNGLRYSRPGAFDGYTLIAPSESTSTYLVDLGGDVVHQWRSKAFPGLQVELLDDGSLLRPGKSRRQTPFSAGNGRGGLIERIAWDGEVVWSYEYASNDHLQHHDVELLPNGNILLLAWERIGRREAIAAGRDPALLGDGELWAEHVVEIDPKTDQIVWKWRSWDHLVQDREPSIPHFGDPAATPHRIDLNYVTDTGIADWQHANSIAYNADLDQIVISVRSFHEIWIIDHSTSTEEASGPAGDLLFRWGNPAAYGKGDAAPRMLFGQHDAEWIAPGLDGAGRISIFNNGTLYRPYSTVEEIVPANEGGRYQLDSNGVHAARVERVVWPREPDPDFFAHHTSGAQRLPNGNTLIADGPHGVIFEVTPDGRVVWKFVNPYFDQQAVSIRLNEKEEFRKRRIFRAERYPADHPGLAALDDRPG